MRVRWLLIVVVGVVAASVIGLLAFLSFGNGDERDTDSRGRAATDTQAGFLVVDQHRAAVFTEGAFSYVRLESKVGRVLAERLLRDTRGLLPLLRQRLAPGTYRLVSYQRPCEGACPRRGVRGLDPPALRCEAAVEIAAGETVAALVRPRVGRGCRVLIGKRVQPGLAQRRGLAVCRGITDGGHHSLRYWARNWRAESTRPEDLGAAYAVMAFQGFELPIRAAAAEGCAEAIRADLRPIRFVLDGRLSVGETVHVSITNVGTRPYLYELFYQACFLSYFDSSGRRFIIPPGTHCDIRANMTIRPRETKRIFNWNLDECVKDRWGCVRSRPLPPGTYTIKGHFKPAGGGRRVQAVDTFEIAAA